MTRNCIRSLLLVEFPPFTVAILFNSSRCQQEVERRYGEVANLLERDNALALWPCGVRDLGRLEP